MATVLVAAVLAATVLVGAVGLALGGGTARAMPADPPPRPSARAAAAGPPYAVAERVFSFTDSSRTVRYPGHPPQARPLTTVVRYPENAPGPVPLIVFGHGYAVTPAYYWRLLRAWAQAGYAVAAPVFPLENEHATGGPDESDLVNQPHDMSFVITRLLAMSAAHTGPLAGLLAPGRIGVSGQSDGAETALAAAYDRHFLDPRIRAAAILSGAEFAGQRRSYFPPGSPPLLATQGTADTVNPPRLTYQFFALARRPKYLLKLLGAPHLPPYVDEQPQLSIITRVTTAFFNLYLKGDAAAAADMSAAGNVPGTATLTTRG